MIPDKNIFALSWNISTEPTLYRELSVNPYSSASLQIISERFPNKPVTDVIKAIILAEPEGKYDRHFKELTPFQQEKELQKQSDNALKINERINEYCEKYAGEFKSLPKEFVYYSLSLVVFETTNLQEVEHAYALHQRRDFKLLIVSIIEDLAPVTSHVLPHRSALGHPFLQTILGASSLIMLFCLTYGLYVNQIESTRNSTYQQEIKKQVLGIKTQKINQTVPVRLIIPSIKVDALIELVGETPNGIMDVPGNAADAGWFDLGPHPGENGNAVIAGHLNTESGTDGVFGQLHKLKAGDKLYVTDNTGITTSFTVRESRAYTPGHADDVFGKSNSAHLNLITCDGTWDEASKSYTKRLVVFTDVTN